ncbi:hypothetical protein ACJ41O_007172 [Fusarium nematophilum]
MSGFEIAGAVLASVPIALEAYDRSGRVFEVFSVFKQHSRELRLLDARLGAQRTIFRNNAINLLVAITKDPAKVQEVKNQPSSESARNGLTMAAAHENRIEALDESMVACRQTAEQIQQTLQTLCLQSEEFRAEVGEKQGNTSTSDWLKSIKTRLKLGLNKPQMGKSIDELRGLNGDFQMITDQITKALRDISNDRQPDMTKKSARNLNLLRRYHRARYASKALYAALQVQWVCSTHQCHLFDVRIIDCEPTRGQKESSVAQYVTCELAITPDSSSSVSKGPLLLEIEQACESDDEDANPQLSMEENTTIQQLTTVLENNAGHFVLASATKTTTTRRGLFDGLRQGNQSPAGPSTAEFAPQLPILTQSLSSFHLEMSNLTSSTSRADPADPSLIDDFCKRCHGAMVDCKARSLLGSWTDPRTRWFGVPHVDVGTSKSLSDIIHWIAEEPVIRSLPRLRLIELAGNLAEGIMQFYSTPWLAPADLGQNVRYRDLAESSVAQVKLKGPYFTARLESARWKGKMRQLPGMAEETALHSRSITAKVDYTEARNKLLFDLGVLMLELGYGRPWNELKRSVRLAGETISDYRAAEKLAQQLVGQMGASYAKIVKKCLGCDFGLGETDLENEDLQRQFLQDVVTGLEQLREQCRALSL